MWMLGVGAKIAPIWSPGAAARFAAPLALALLGGVLTGCASSGLMDVPPAHVAAEPYQNMTCERMKSEAGALNSRKADLAPALFPSISEEEREKRLAQINGELKTLSEVSSQKCSTSR
jgi:predicted small lipoprotein YifL